MEDKHYLGKGLGFLIPGGVLGIFSINVPFLFQLRYLNYASTLFIVFGLILCVAIAFIIIGIYNLSQLRKYKHYKYQNRKESTCYITDLYKEIVRGRSFYGYTRYIIQVCYKTESGANLYKKFSIFESDFSRLAKGMVLTCDVFEEDCYLDIHNIQIVEAE